MLWSPSPPPRPRWRTRFPTRCSCLISTTRSVRWTKSPLPPPPTTSSTSFSAPSASESRQRAETLPPECRRLLCRAVERDPKRVGEFSLRRFGKLHVKPVALLLERKLRSGSQQGNRLHAPALGGSARPQRMDHGLPAGRPGEFDRVEHIAVGCEAKVFRRIGLGVGVVKGTGRHLRWTLSKPCPGPRPVDGLSIDLQPGAHRAQHGLYFIGNRAVRARPDIEKEISVLAHDIDQLVNDELGGLEGVVLNVSPGFVADRSIGLPGQWADAGELAPLDVEHGGLLLHGEILVVDDADAGTVLKRGVVVEGGEARQVFADRGLTDPPIEIDDLRLVLQDDFSRAREPVVGPFMRHESESVRQGRTVLCLEPPVGGSIEGGVLRVVDV